MLLINFDNIDPIYFEESPNSAFVLYDKMDLCKVSFLFFLILFWIIIKFYFLPFPFAFLSF